MQKLKLALNILVSFIVPLLLLPLNMSANHPLTACPCPRPPADQTEAAHTEPECGRADSLPLRPVGTGKSSGCDLRGVDVGNPR